MAEPRRVSLTSSVFPMAVIPTAKSSGEVNPESKSVLFQTVYFDIEQPTEQFNPVYDFEKLFAAQKKSSTDESKPVDDPFGEKDEEEKLAKLAKHFEEKYGSTGPRDLSDLGEGYDQNDPFVDDANLAEAVIPPGWTTQHGGFYISAGPLYMRQLRPKEEEAHVYESVGTEECLAEMRSGNGVPAKRKTVELESGDSDDEEEVQPKRKRIPANDYFDDDKIDTVPLEVVKKCTPKTVATLLAKRSTPKEVTKVVESTPSIASEELTTVKQLGNPSGVSIIRPTPKRIEKEQRLVSPEGKAWQVSEGKWDPNSSAAAGDTSPALRAVIDKLTNIAQTWDGGKCNFFSVEHNPVINDLLLELEYECRRLRCGLRSAIYSYLADSLPCTKETLIKRARKLREADVEAKTLEILNQLRNAIQSEPEFGNGIDPTSKHFKSPIRKLIGSAVKRKVDVYDVNRSRFATQEEFIRHFVDSELLPLWANRSLEKESLYSEALLALVEALRPKPRGLSSKPRSNPQPSTSGDGQRIISPSAPVPVTIEKSAIPATSFSLKPSTQDSRIFSLNQERGVNSSRPAFSKSQVIQQKEKLNKDHADDVLPTDLSSGRRNLKSSESVAVHDGPSSSLPSVRPRSTESSNQTSSERKSNKVDSRSGVSAGHSRSHQSDAPGLLITEEKSPFLQPMSMKSVPGGSNKLPESSRSPKVLPMPNELPISNRNVGSPGSAFRKSSASNEKRQEKSKNSESRIISHQSVTLETVKSSSSSKPARPKSQNSKGNSSAIAFNPANSFSVASLTSPFLGLSNHQFMGLPGLPTDSLYFGYPSFPTFSAEGLGLSSLMAHNSGAFSGVPSVGRTTQRTNSSSPFSNDAPANPRSS